MKIKQGYERFQTFEPVKVEPPGFLLIDRRAWLLDWSPLWVPAVCAQAHKIHGCVKRPVDWTKPAEPLAGAGDFPGVLTKVVSTGRNFALSVSDWRKTSL